MIVYECDKCGKIYIKSERPEDDKCVECNRFLVSKSMTIEEYERQNDKRDDEKFVIEDTNSKKSSIADEERTTLKPDKRLERHGKETKENQIKNESNNIKSTPGKAIADKDINTYIEGRVVSVNSDNSYKRSLFNKIKDKILFKQRSSDMCNIIKLRCKDKDGIDIDKTLVFYGVIRGGTGIISTGSKIRVWGENNKNNEYIVERLVLDDNSEIQLMKEGVDYLIAICPIILLIGLIMLLSISKGIVNIVSDISSTEINVAKYIFFFLVSFFVTMKIKRNTIMLKRIKISAGVGIFVVLLMFVL